MDLPAGLEGLYPFWISRLVAALIHGRRRALEHVELLRVLAQMRHALNRGGPGPDDAYAFVVQFVQAPGGIASGVVVVPTTRVEGMSLERLDSRDRGQLGPVQRPTRHDHKARLEDIVPLSRDRPAPCFLIPARLFDLGLEAGPRVEVEVLPDPLRMRKDLRREGVLLLGDVAGLFEERQIHVGFDVTLRAGIAVPVPGPAKIPRFLDNTNIGDPGLLQPRRRQQAAKTAADDEHVEFFVQRGAREARLDVGIYI